jgi:hypothetical protein
LSLTARVVIVCSCIPILKTIARFPAAVLPDQDENQISKKAKQHEHPRMTAEGAMQVNVRIIKLWWSTGDISV